MIKIINVVGARPNFMKISPIISALRNYPDQIHQKLVHTGQHYDDQMSRIFFDDLGIPKPDINLGIGSGSHALQTAEVMIAFEKICLSEKPNLVIVVGDVNSTLACALTAKKLGIKVAHIEAGLRSKDMSMPEEVNRLCTDAISDYLFTTDHYANTNLFNEGIPSKRIFFVGNVMIDTLLRFRDKAKNLKIAEKFGLIPGQYVLTTLHRPSNVDSPEILQKLLQVISQIAKKLPVIFPIHPRTKKNAEIFKLSHYFSNHLENGKIYITEPLGYIEFQSLNMFAKFVITDSGGIQEETTILDVPCITVRPNTERPITCDVGTNHVVGNDPQNIVKAVSSIINKKSARSKKPDKWDGMASERIVENILKLMS